MEMKRERLHHFSSIKLFLVLKASMANGGNVCMVEEGGRILLALGN